MNNNTNTVKNSKTKNRIIFVLTLIAIIAFIVACFTGAYFTLKGADLLFTNVFNFGNMALCKSFLLKNILTIVYIVAAVRFIAVPVIKRKIAKVRAAAEAKESRNDGRTYIDTTATEL